MNPRARNGLIGLISLTMPLAACAKQDAGGAAAIAPTIAQSSAPQIVTGLPDFTRLVEQVAPGVVNIDATIGGGDSSADDDEQASDSDSDGDDDQSQLDQSQIPEIFRQIFGPGMQMPGQGGGRGNARPRGESMGSGFIISPDGYILTNNHVVDGSSNVKVKLSDGRSFKAKVIGTDKGYDVALLKIDAKSLPSLRMGESNNLKAGQWVVAIGSPFGLDHSVTAGVVSATGRTQAGMGGSNYVRFIQTDVAINQGNSGGPLLNTSGEVVGINSQIFSQSGGYMGISFAIPIDLAISAADQLKKTGKVSRAMLGVAMNAEISESMAKKLGLPDTNGVMVTTVSPGSGAEKAGIKPMDVITEFNGEKVTDYSDLPSRVAPLPPGTKVTLTVIRDGKPRKVDVTLTALDQKALDATTGGGRDKEDSADKAPSVTPKVLGFSVQALPEAQRQRLGLPDGGVVISGVNRDLAADTGLSPGLIVLQVNRSAIGSVADFNKAVAGVKKGDVLMLLIQSQRGVKQFVAVTVGGEG
ncbi:Do family serine endopeptidase [Pseudoxanthomonas sp.]|uniref:Do family serine endopeptidase n=1 Tax=Pseudoxanthomonas sp. TaxID=1871049 RepID=UPI002636A572|nr:Do family serine endopeptidase [Pseudoxanthomonas sp.]WDS36146.1 MAG: Do family serine endopeptidase [Pseudoxanthomonas sp.]